MESRSAGRQQCAAACSLAADLRTRAQGKTENAGHMGGGDPGGIKSGPTAVGFAVDSQAGIIGLQALNKIIQNTCCCGEAGTAPAGGLADAASAWPRPRPAAAPAPHRAPTPATSRAGIAPRPLEAPGGRMAGDMSRACGGRGGGGEPHDCSLCALPPPRAPPSSPHSPCSPSSTPLFLLPHSSLPPSPPPPPTPQLCIFTTASRASLDSATTASPGAVPASADSSTVAAAARSACALPVAAASAWYCLSCAPVPCRERGPAGEDRGHRRGSPLSH